MLNNALYVYGIVKFGFNLEWEEPGVNGKKVYILNNNSFSALAHNCKEEAYATKDLEKFKELIVAHNIVLDRAIEDFDGVIPFPFNTIIKKRGKETAERVLKEWLGENQEKLKHIWDKIGGRKEYCFKIYCNKEKLIEESSINKIENMDYIENTGPGLNYLLEEKAKLQISETLYHKINQLKQDFYNKIKKVVYDIKIDTPRVILDEKEKLLISFSVLGDDNVVRKINKIFGQNDERFSFQLSGPYAPYSFVENEKI